MKRSKRSGKKLLITVAVVAVIAGIGALMNLRPVETFEEKSRDLEEIVNTMTDSMTEINKTIEESVNSVVHTADSAITLLNDIESIAAEVEENRNIANSLNEEVNSFKKLA